MPVAGAHTPDELHELLTPWLSDQVGQPVTVSEVEVPQANGFSNETFLLKAAWGDENADLVLRSQAPEHQVFPVVDLLAQQYTTMKLLGEHTDIAVPRVRWAESSPELLGRPFFLMDRLYGDVPGDNPPFMRESFVIEMSVEDRRRWHTNAADVLMQVAKVDWRATGVDYLDLARFGALGPEQRQGYAQYFHEWTLNGEAHPVADPALEWLVANWPDDGEHLELCWGDARPGNQMFSGGEVIGVFDWEMVHIGNAEADLGWWTLLQRFSSESMGVELPEGMLTRAETIARWEASMGRTADHVDFYERFAAFQFSLIFVKLSRAMNLGMEVDNPVANLAVKLFAE